MSDMPYSVTICRATLVARSMSFCGAGGDVADHDLLGHAPAHQHRELVAQLLAGHHELVLLGQRERVAERPAARDHPDLVDRVRVRAGRGRRARGRPRDTRSGALAARSSRGTCVRGRPSRGRWPPRSRSSRSRFLFRRAASSAASLITFARSAPVNPGVRRARIVQVHGLVERLAARVHLQDRLAALEVWPVDHDLPVEPARSQAARGPRCRDGSSPP